MEQFSETCFYNDSDSLESIQSDFDEAFDSFYEQDHYDKMVASIKEDVIMNVLNDPTSREYYKYFNLEDEINLSTEFHEYNNIFKSNVKNIKQQNKSSPKTHDKTSTLLDIDSYKKLQKSLEQDIDELSKSIKSFDETKKMTEMKTFYDIHGYSTEFNLCVSIDDKYKCYLQDKKLFEVSSDTIEKNNTRVTVIKKKKYSPNGGSTSKGKSSKRGRRYFKHKDQTPVMKGAFVQRHDGVTWVKSSNLKPHEKYIAIKNHVVKNNQVQKREQNTKQRLRNKKNKSRKVVCVDVNKKPVLVTHSVSNIDDIEENESDFETTEDFENFKKQMIDIKTQEEEEEKLFLKNIREKIVDMKPVIEVKKSESCVQSTIMDNDDEYFVNWACKIGWVKKPIVNTSQKYNNIRRKKKSKHIYFENLDMTHENNYTSEKCKGKHIMFCKFVKDDKKCMHKTCKFAHSIDELIRKPCKFGKKCRKVMWSEDKQRYVNSSKDDRNCLFWHDDETVDMYTKRHEIPYNKVSGNTMSSREEKHVLNKSIVNNMYTVKPTLIRPEISNSFPTWADVLKGNMKHHKTKKLNPDIKLCKTSTPPLNIQHKQKKLSNVEDVELNKIKQFCDHDFKHNAYVPFMKPSIESRGLKKVRPYIHKEQPVHIKTDKNTSKILLKYLVKHGYSNIQITIQ